MPADLHSILRIEVPVIVQIAERTMRLKEVMNIVPGAIIELPKLSHEELDLLVSHKQIGTGRAVKVGENFGIRVTYIGDVRQRIQAMSDGEGEGEALPNSLDFVDGARSSHAAAAPAATGAE